MDIMNDRPPETVVNTTTAMTGADTQRDAHDESKDMGIDLSKLYAVTCRKNCQIGATNTKNGTSMRLDLGDGDALTVQHVQEGIIHLRYQNEDVSAVITRRLGQFRWEIDNGYWTVDEKDFLGFQPRRIIVETWKKIYASSPFRPK